MASIQYQSITSLSELKPGDHIRVPPSSRDGKRVYSHHQMVVRVADEKTLEVIHNTREQGVCQERTSCRPENVTVLKYWSKYTGHQAVKRAKERIGENKYNLVIENCEHFIFEVRTGKKESKQVQAARNGGVVGGGAGGLAVGGAGAGIGALVGGAIGFIAPFGGPIAGAVLGSVIGGGIGVLVGGGGGGAGGGFLNLRLINKKRN